MNMINIKVTLPGYNLNSSISQFIGNEENILNGCKFWINKTINSPDIWFIFENVIDKYESCNINPENIIFLSAETSYNDEHFLKDPRQKFLDQFGYIYSSYDVKESSIKSIPFLPWMINSNHGDSIYAPSKRDVNYFSEMKKIEKTKILSVICSNKDFTPGHNKRLQFVYDLKEHFGDSLDWFGNGINPLEEKWSGIAPYKYHISLENKSKSYVVSEKLFDSFLGLSFPFYYGAQNASDFFPKESFENIDIEDTKKSIEIIERAIQNSLYEKNISFLLESKNLVIKDYNLFYRLSIIAKSRSHENSTSLKKYKIFNLKSFEDKYQAKQDYLKKIYNFLRLVKNFLIRK